jgi:glycosyltransferase involved in cell wall biosynthesis
MAEINVILISSVRPEPTSAGQITLYRHLVGQPGINLKTYGSEPQRLTFSAAIRRLIGRLGRTRFHRLGEDFWVLWGARWLDPFLPRTIAQGGPTVVLTVAHGDACMAALRFAERHKLPLVTLFHDWWPDIPSLHAPFRRQLERNFKLLYKRSSVAFCVCDGMRTALGNDGTSFLLFPIPKLPQPTAVFAAGRKESAPPFKIFCFGNLVDYGSLLAGALLELKGDATMRLEVSGANPGWPPAFQQETRMQGLWKEFLPRNEFDRWLGEADAFLVPMAFAKSLRRRMETSFPSKLIEASQWGKPLVIWGPDYCSAVKWARAENGALSVTDPNPAALRKALENLSQSPEDQQRLSHAAVRAARSEFHPATIHAQFIDILCRAARSSKSNFATSRHLCPSQEGA